MICSRSDSRTSFGSIFDSPMGAATFATKCGERVIFYNFCFLFWNYNFHRSILTCCRRVIFYNFSCLHRWTFLYFYIYLLKVGSPLHSVGSCDSLDERSRSYSIGEQPFSANFSPCQAMLTSTSTKSLISTIISCQDSQMIISHDDIYFQWGAASQASTLSPTPSVATGYHP